jgi:TolA-binding protein
MRIHRTSIAAVALAACATVCLAQAPPAPAPTAPAAVAPAETPDPAADQAAQKVVPAPGTVLRTTEDSVLGTTTAVSESPAVRLAEGRLLAGDREIEAKAVESMAELMKQLNIVRRPVAVGQREVDETTAGALFDQKQLRALLGDNPTVVYQVVYKNAPIPDPMIVPWVRNVKILQERYDEALDLLAKGKVTQGQEALNAIVNEFPNTNYAQQAQALLSQIRRLEAPTPESVQKLAQAKLPAPTEIVIDPAFRISSVLTNSANPAENRVMIGGRSYGVGDKPRGFSGYTILAVSDDLVEVEVSQDGQKKNFSVRVGQASGTKR